jgi:hypothetical protein
VGAASFAACISPLQQLARSQRCECSLSARLLQLRRIACAPKLAYGDVNLNSDRLEQWRVKKQQSAASSSPNPPPGDWSHRLVSLHERPLRGGLVLEQRPKKKFLMQSDWAKNKERLQETGMDPPFNHDQILVDDNRGAILNVRGAPVVCCSLRQRRRWQRLICDADGLSWTRDSS